MIRGRHRGLPVAIDRAVMLPLEFQKSDDDFAAEKPERPSESNQRARESKQGAKAKISRNDKEGNNGGWRRSTDEARLGHARKKAADEDSS